MDQDAAGLRAALQDRFETITVDDLQEAMSAISRDDVVACFSREWMERRCDTSEPGWCNRILKDLPDGIVLIDQENVVHWANPRFRQLSGTDAVEGQGFYAVLDHPEILGPDFCPFHTALATGKTSATTLRVADKHYYQLHVSLLRGRPTHPRQLVVVVRDITSEMHKQQKLEAIHHAGTMLTDLMPEEIFDMTVEDRIELLKANILQSTQDILNYNVIEIRMLDQNTGCLVPLLVEGMDEEAAHRPLLAEPRGHGVTGFVASSGQSYLCDDTEHDPLYIPGFEGARSSMTVPLVLHEQVIGTFNVEHEAPGAFSQNDLMFLEIFARDVALALNTLELLTAQGMNTAMKSVEAIHRAVARPIDAILNQAVDVLETYIGHDPEIEQRLKTLLREAREIRHLIQEVGKGLAPSDAVPAGVQTEDRERFAGRRILVVDSDAEMLDSAHLTLERYGCIVETAQSGAQAVLMVRASTAEAPYDVIITEVRLPDMTGYELLVQLKRLFAERVPLVLMQGFGHDPGHSIVKARQDGLHYKAVLYKPFRVEQLLDVIETILEWSQEPQSPGGGGENNR